MSKNTYISTKKNGSPKLRPGPKPGFKVPAKMTPNAWVQQQQGKSEMYGAFSPLTEVDIDSRTTLNDLSDMFGDKVSLKFTPINQVVDTTTTILENALSHLETLRSGIERAQRKDISDVREFGDTYASSLLAGVEQVIDYADLLRIITHFKDGIAARRVNKVLA